MQNYKKEKVNISIGTIITVGCVLLYRLALDYIYVNYISIKWNYTGFDLNYSLSNLLISLFAVIICIIAISENLKKDKPSSYIVVLLNLIAFIPATTLIAYMPTEKEFIVLLLGYWFLLNFYNFLIPYFKIPKLSEEDSKFIFNALIILFTGTVLFVSFYYTGFRINLDLFSVYDLREESLSYNMPVILNYLFSASRAVVPTIMIYKLSQQQHIQFSFFLLIGFLMFSVNGQRSVLFSLMLALLGYFFYKKNFSHYFSIALLGISLIAIFEFFLNKASLISDIFIRRVLFVPQLLNYNYYDFFKNYDFDYFRQSLFSNLGFESPYDISITILIGSLYQGGNANNGLFSDAYYNLGVVGIFLMPLLIILALRIFDACSDGLNNRILIASIITITFNFISSSFFTILLTHGFIAICITLYVMPRNSKLLERSDINS